MTYLLKDEDGDVYAAVSNVGPADIARAQRLVDIALQNTKWDDNCYADAARRLELSEPETVSGKACLVARYLIEKCGGTELTFEAWRCGL